MIKDLQPKQGSVEIEGDVTSKGETKTWSKFGKEGKVCTAELKDASGTIKLSLWNDDCDKVNVGDHIKISNGFVSEYQGEKQLTTGRFGKLEILSSGGAAPAEPKQSADEENLEFEE